MPARESRRAYDAAYEELQKRNGKSNVPSHDAKQQYHETKTCLTFHAPATWRTKS